MSNVLIEPTQFSRFAPVHTVDTFSSTVVASERSTTGGTISHMPLNVLSLTHVANVITITAAQLPSVFQGHVNLNCAAATVVNLPTTAQLIEAVMGVTGSTMGAGGSYVDVTFHNQAIGGGGVATLTAADGNTTFSTEPLAAAIAVADFAAFRFYVHIGGTNAVRVARMSGHALA